MADTKKYFIGLDIGTDSVGYATVNERYELCKYNGEPMWGSHLFDATNQCEKRRGFRTARRRLDRRQQRVQLVDEIMAKEVVKIDPNFYIRKRESRLFRSDKTNKDDIYTYFNDDNYNDKDYNKQFPTIHHLICHLMNCKEKPDVRLVNIALDWLVAHRGHFLSEISPNNVDKVTDFTIVYQEFIDYFEFNGYEKPWNNIDINEFGNILKAKVGINKRNSMFADLLFNGKIPKEKKALVKFLSGGKVKVKDLFENSSVEDDVSISISDDMETVLPQLGDEGELVARMAAMYDWSLLADLLGDNTYISESKVDIYEKHRKDLRNLKDFVNKYADDKYKAIFVDSDEKTANYVAYSYNTKWVGKKNKRPKQKCSKEDFYKFLKKTINFDTLNIQDEKDKLYVESVLNDIGNSIFMPKQVDSDNRIIPYQVYYVEYKKILDNMLGYYDFLQEKDDEGYSNYNKLESIFRFKIPYYVGPLRKDGNKIAWIERKAEGKIYPWNFEDKVDESKSEKEFIARMTNSCTYIPGENVLPKWSLLYSKFMVLNEINNIKVSGMPLSIEAKQELYNNVFLRKVRVSTKDIREYLVCNGYMYKDEAMTGIDITVKSSLKAQCEFRLLMEKGILSSDDVEKIIERNSYTEERVRIKKWLKENYSQLSEDDYKYVSKLKYKDFGKLSKFLLVGLVGCNKETGESGTILHFLWSTNENFMKLLSSDYTFMEQISELRREYYAENKMTIAKQLEELGISNAVKRPVIRSLAVVDDVVKTMGHAPSKIFIEMARGAEEKKRTVTRKEQILELYKQVDDDTTELEKQLESMGDMANNRLQRDELFLYYMQLGRCMYSGEAIDIAQLGSTIYNIDHIYPQSLVKDDSIVNNRVLVLSRINAEKNADLLDSSIREKMYSMWKHYCDKGLISKEKFARLTRNKAFTEDEKWGFINRQLVETRQSTKAVTQMLANIYPETEIVFVKAGLSSSYRHEVLNITKTRLVNDLHHAKDAYLSIVVGNVYNERFTKKWFNINEKYSIKTTTLFGHDIIHGENIIWKANEDNDKVRKILCKNNIHLTRYTYCKKGGFFAQTPVKASEGLVPLKKGLDTARYGGYNDAAASFFVLARYDKGKKKEVSFIPVELMVKDRFIQDDLFAIQYVQHFLQSMNSKEIANVELLLDKRIIKIKTLLSLDGFEVWLNGKSNKGAIVTLSNAMSMKVPDIYEDYIKNLERYSEKKSNNNKIIHDEEHDGLSFVKNLDLYEYLSNKITDTVFSKIPGNISSLLNSDKDKFEGLDFDKQVSMLLRIISYLKTGRTGAIDLSELGEKKSVGAIYIGANISSLKYNSIKIIDESPAGLHRKESINLKELL